ncbi:hypothetical protein GQ44DRAFT_751726 [Phaeosphaeriaceae sp. PMI808]|nr:hypothetical protein GQ44DRAFT_751726 [Phaeosphaeriaceae sp. PMI808]
MHIQAPHLWLPGLQAVGSTLKLPRDQILTIINIITAEQKKDVEKLSWQEWLKAVRLMAFSSQSQQQIMNVTIALAFLRESARRNIAVSPTDLGQVWTIAKDVLQCTSLAWSIMRNVDGSFAIPLWSFNEDGPIHELFRLHIWLPDVERVDPNFDVHMHQPFVQSWVLAGECKNHIFDVVAVREGNATHAEYPVGWKEPNDEESRTTYEVHSKSSTIINTGKLVCVLPRDTKLHVRNMSYHIPEGVFHKIEVEPDVLHAQLHFFDSIRGYTHDAPVLGPTSLIEYVIHRESANLNVVEIARLVADIRNWEVLQGIGLEHSGRGEWEEALRSYRTALYICQKNKWLDRPQYKHVSLGKIGKMYRMLGRYDQACESCKQLFSTHHNLDFAAEEQYHGAIQLNLEKFAYRAIGNIGMVNYQLYLLNKDDALLSTAISQLNERIDRAQRFGDVILEAIGYSRLSLCYIAKGDFERAVQVAQKNYDLTCIGNDATKIGFAKAFFGRALLYAGRKGEALTLFNAPHGCSPIIALCNEISGEHRQYIIEMINAGADLKLRDQQGYSALECAVYNGDVTTAKIIEEGLRAQILREGGNVDEQLTRFKYEATLRKGYRDIFQDRLRPVLLDASKDSTLQTLRQTYAASLSNDTDRQNAFDGLKFIRYTDFLRCSRLPRSNGGYTKEFTIGEGSPQNPFILFFSYRWISKGSDAQASNFSPDDDANTQYNRMLRAIKQFIDLHRDIDQDQLCIWIDFACVDQDHQRPGVAALPLNLAQCNAMISLVDEKYYERSWCCVEVLMIQTLRKAYGIHLWYEHLIDPVNDKESLRTGP